MLDRKSWLLVFLAQPSGPYPVDQIRVMKGMFLWSQEGPSPARNLYDFRPYDFGPFDASVYRDLEALGTEGMIRVEPVAGTSRRIFEVTAKGARRAGELQEQVSAEVIQQLRTIKEQVSSQDFTTLLKDIYARYPKYAVRSVARV